MNSRKIKTQEDLDKVYVLRAMIIIDEAVIRWANRYADLAQKEAEACEDAKRRKELLEMSEACRNVPAKPAKNFREAFQFLYFVFLMQSRQTTTLWDDWIRYCILFTKRMLPKVFWMMSLFWNICSAIA